jgi:hypothetical protein
MGGLSEPTLAFAVIARSSSLGRSTLDRHPGESREPFAVAPRLVIPAKAANFQLVIPAKAGIQ